jgi:hypothetical protein
MTTSMHLLLSPKAAHKDDEFFGGNPFDSGIQKLRGPRPPAASNCGRARSGERGGHDRKELGLPDASVAGAVPNRSVHRHDLRIATAVVPLTPEGRLQCGMERAADPLRSPAAADCGRKLHLRMRHTLARSGERDGYAGREECRTADAGGTGGGRNGTGRRGTTLSAAGVRCASGLRAGQPHLRMRDKRARSGERGGQECEPMRALGARGDSPVPRRGGTRWKIASSIGLLTP